MAIIVADESEINKYAKDNKMEVEDACKAAGFKKQVQDEM